MIVLKLISKNIRVDTIFEDNKIVHGKYETCSKTKKLIEFLSSSQTIATFSMKPSIVPFY